MFLKINGYMSYPFDFQLVILSSESYRKSLNETEYMNNFNEIKSLCYSH